MVNKCSSATAEDFVYLFGLYHYLILSMNLRTSFFFLLLLVIVSCNDDEQTATPQLRMISATVGGVSLESNTAAVRANPLIVMTFDAALNPEDFESGLTLAAENGNEVSATITYRSASSQAVIAPQLDFDTNYTLRINAIPIGSNGQSLRNPVVFQFTTAQDEVIRSMAPCVTGCDQSIDFNIGGANKSFSFFSSYPIYEENAVWEELTSAVIVLHGINRNGDDYFDWMNTTLADLNLQSSTILIAPAFKVEEEADSNELYWSRLGWREGLNSMDGAALSSFSVMDSLILQLSDNEHFPVLDQIIVTGHSSGGLFTHVYGASNRVESISQKEISYVVANSQYFYYPTGQRINESTNTLFTPANCAVYKRWPLGFDGKPPYLSETSIERLNSQFTERSIVYLLGNGNQSDPSLNTTDCDATLLGSSRFARGENMFEFMQLTYGAGHQHAKHIVNGVGHDGQGMYQSNEFGVLLNSLIAQ